MNTEDRMQFIYDAMGPCYWCVDKDCKDHHQEVARKISERWEDDNDDTWIRAINEGRAAQ